MLLLGEKMTGNGAPGTEPAHNEDHLDQLLRGFKSRNQFRSDPNYVLEPMDLTTSIPDRFVKILRSTWEYQNGYYYILPNQTLQ